jgi:hypothetical protein
MKRVLNILSHIHHHNPNFIGIFNDAAESVWINDYVLFDNKSLKHPAYVSENKITVFALNSEFLPWLREVQSHYDLIIMHGSFNPTIWSLLASREDICKKTCWIVFGGDLIIEQYIQNPEVLAKIEFNRKLAVKNLKRMWVISNDEKTVIDKKYGSSDNVDKYLLPIFEPKAVQSNINTPYDFLLGNSADKANHHEKSLTLLHEYQPQRSLLCPLSYPTCARQAEIATLGNTLFGQNFTALISIMEIDLYFAMIKNCRAFILPHTRQQAGQHWIFALKHGIPIYAEIKSPFAKLISERGGVIFELEDLKQPNIKFNSIEENKRVFKDFFSRDKLIELWRQSIMQNLN